MNKIKDYIFNCFDLTVLGCNICSVNHQREKQNEYILYNLIHIPFSTAQAITIQIDLTIFQCMKNSHSTALTRR